MATVSVTEVTTFQFASTALTTMVNAAPAACALGVPVLPDAVPAAAVSPGSNSCSLVNDPALTVVVALVFAVSGPTLASVAVTVWLPAVFGVTVKVFVPATSGALAGSVALASDDEIAIVCVLLT